jgi:hypothetical protein
MNRLPLSVCAVVCFSFSVETLRGDPLDDLVVAYTNVSTVDGQLEVPNPLKGRRHYVTFAIAPDGRFMMKHFIEFQSRLGAAWMTKPKHIEHFDGEKIRMTESGGSSEYTEIGASEILRQTSGLMQWAFCPGVVVRPLATALRERTDLKITPDQGMTTASSVKGRVAVSWDSRFRVTKLMFGTDPLESVTYEYGGFTPVIDGVPELPTTRTDIIRSQAGRKVPFDQRHTGNITLTKSKDPELSVRFDAAALGLMKYDPVTGDVTFPDGRLLYNRKHFEASLDESSWWKTLRPWAFGALAVGVVVGAFYTIRRLRAG